MNSPFSSKGSTFGDGSDNFVDKLVSIEYCNVIVLEKLKNMIKGVKKLPKKYRNKLYLMQYRRFQYFNCQALKHGLL